MEKKAVNPKMIYYLRWTARIWSLLVLAIAAMVVLQPYPGPIPTPKGSEAIELAFYLVAVLGLLLAWRWELAGGLLAIGGVLASEVAYRMFRGEWFVKLPIVFLTSLQSHALSLLGSEMGAYLRKPICPEELLRTVARCIGARPEEIVFTGSGTESDNIAIQDCHLPAAFQQQGSYNFGCG